MRFGVNGDNINIPFNNIDGIYQILLSNYNNNELKRFFGAVEHDNHVHINIEFRTIVFNEKTKKQLYNLFYQHYPELKVSKGAKALTCVKIKSTPKIKYWTKDQEYDMQLCYPMKDIDFNHRSKFKSYNYTDGEIQNCKNRYYQLQQIKNQYYENLRINKIKETNNNKLKFIEYAEKLLKDKITIKLIRNITISYFEDIGRPFKEYEIYSHYNLLVAKYMPDKHKNTWTKKLINYDPFNN